MYKDIRPNLGFMKSILFTLTIFLTIAALKSRQDSSEDIPECIQQKIDSLKKQPGSVRVQVKEYQYQNRKVFQFSGMDQDNMVIDETCNAVFVETTNAGDSKFKNFIAHAKETGLVWKHER